MTKDDPTCENCKNWNKDVREGKDFGKCNSDKFIYTVFDRYCETFDGKCPTSDCLTYQDSEGYSAGFSTGKDFGCIHFQNKF